MAISHDASNSSQVANSNTLTIAHVAGTGSNRLMTVHYGNSDASLEKSPDSVDYDATDSLSVWVQQNDAASNVHNSIWYVVANSQTSGNLVVTLPTAGGTMDEQAGGVATWFGVDQSTPLDTGVTNTGTSSSAISLTVSSATGDVVIDQVYTITDSGGATLTVGGGQTEISNEAFAAWVNEGASYESGAASVDMTWTISKSGSWWSCGANINAAAAGGATSLVYKPQRKHNHLLVR